MNILNIADYAVSELSFADMASIEGGGFIDTVRSVGKAVGHAVGYAAGAVKDFISTNNDREVAMSETLMNCI
jgi:hypothetical protein